MTTNDDEEDYTDAVKGTATTSASANNVDGNANAGVDYSTMSDSDLIKLDLLKGLLSKNVNLSDFELGELTGFTEKQVGDIRSTQLKSTLDSSDVPLSWDYVLVFDVGNKDDKHMPSKKDKKDRTDDDNDVEWEEGMPQDKYYGQLFNNFWQRLESAKLSVEAYRSSNKKLMFLIVGITEKNLKYWADERDTDLLIDPIGGVEVGRQRRFPLALRTKLQSELDAENDDNKDNGGNLLNKMGNQVVNAANKVGNIAAMANIFEETLDLGNWSFLYGEYSQQANPKVYKQYNRLRTNDNLTTVFDEKTRLRIIYESIISDSNEGGAEIKIEDCCKSKKHPLIAVFPLHNAEVLDNFTKTWIKNWNPLKLMWCPLDDIRDYFGEPVAFYFGFLSFYLKWLISPAIVGLIFFIWQIGAKEIAVTGIPLMCFFMIFWSVAFVDFWARAESRYRLLWGMTKFQEKAVARPQFTGEWTHDSVSGLWAEEFPFFKRVIRISAVLSVVLLWLSCCIVCVIYILLFRDADPNNLVIKIGLGVANGAMIFVFDIVYKLLSSYGNEWENHRTEQDYQNALIAKSFFFKFFNSFASLFYLGFVRPEVKGLNYYVHFYIKVCGAAPQYMSQMLVNYDSSYDDDGGLADQTDLNDVDKTACIAASSADCGGEPVSCVGGDAAYQACIDDLKDDNLWRYVIDGYYLSDSTQSCPTQLQNYADGDFYDVSKSDDNPLQCLGGCDSTETLFEQNEAVLGEIQIQLLSLFLTAIVIQNTLEVGIPFLGEYIRNKKKIKAAAAAGEETQISEAEDQANKAAYDNTIDDMSEMIIQFGYVTLFVMAFPLTPLLAIVNNIIEMKVDATNLVKTSQRPHPNGSYGLGTWNSVLAFFSIIAVGTNVALITWRTKFVTEVFEDNEASKWIFFSILSITLALIVAAEKYIIPDVPGAVVLAIERQRLVESVLILGSAVDECADTPPVDDDDGSIPFDPSLEFIDVETLPDIPLDNLTYGGKDV